MAQIAPRLHGAPESLLQLRQQLLETRRRETPAATLDCVAHMLLYLDQPQRVLELALTHLVGRLGVCRGDAGLGQPEAERFVASAAYVEPGRAAPTTLGMQLPNRHALLQQVWRTAQPVRIEAVAHNRQLGTLREGFVALRTTAMLARRVEYQGRMLGLICLDHTQAQHQWQAHELHLMDEFCGTFLAPVLAHSLAHHAPAPTATLSTAEQAVVRLAARGLSYAEIAQVLDKSIRTVDHQLRSARQKLGARNQVELIQRSAAWLLWGLQSEGNDEPSSIS
ncbi:MAG: LuxR C-terminal-related transcriptional regulator [Chloroflexaceae bacterium]|nr:LuxR C-terminal-related transcriptional regulator [Chloroflexaceae bacterium]